MSRRLSFSDRWSRVGSSRHVFLYPSSSPEEVPGGPSFFGLSLTSTKFVVDENNGVVTLPLTFIVYGDRLAPRVSSVRLPYRTEDGVR